MTLWYKDDTSLESARVTPQIPSTAQGLPCDPCQANERILGLWLECSEKIPSLSWDCGQLADTEATWESWRMKPTSGKVLEKAWS